GHVTGVQTCALPIYLDESRSREGHTQADGTFRVAGCEPGEQLVTAHADGFAPAVILLKLEANAPPVSLTLGPGKTLRIRVVDQRSEERRVGKESRSR